MLLQSLDGLPAFVAYFCLAAVFVVIFLLIYTRITPMNEFELIRKNVPGAAIALGLSVFGFTLPLASAIAHASDLIDCAIWGVVALIAQIITFYAVLSNKGILPLLWEMYPDHPNLLAVDKDDGPYGAEGYVRQAIAPLPQFDGNYAVLGSWFAAGVPCGLSVREDSGPITKNTSRFLPHAIVG
jgi:putative membrane protein